MITALLIGAGALWLLGRKQKAIGKVERIKRRIYKEVSMAQGEGVDFSKKFDELTAAEIDALQAVGNEVAWKQSKRSIESGKSYAEAYFNSLRRAWNAVSGVQGIGATAYDVYDRDGNVCLTWTDVTEHIKQEPEAKVLLALPPHIEKKKKKKSKVSDEEYADREAFAREFMEEYAKKRPADANELYKGLHKEHYNGDWDINDLPENTYEGIIKSFAIKELKVKQPNLWFLGLKTTTYGNVTSAAARAAEALLDAEQNAYNDAGWSQSEESLNDIRRALLDRAKLMQVVVNPYKEYEDKTHRVKTYDPHYDREIEKLVHDYGDVVSGDERYNYLDKINYVVWVSKKMGGSITYYPIRSYPDYDGAEIFVLNKYGKSGAKVIPVWDVPIEKITGII